VSEWLSALLHPDLAGYTAFGLYAVLFGLIFTETGLLVGFFLPGDTVLFTSGLLAAHPDSPLSLPVLVVGVAVAAVLGDAVGYWCGRRLGRPWVERRAGRLARHLPGAEAFFARWGWSAVVVARFIPWLRTFTPIVAGTAVMTYPRFLSANVVGALVWASGLVLAGYIAYSVPWVRYLAYAIAIASILASIIGPLVVRRRRRAAAGDAAPPAGS
jgi:membrane-associated protein